MRAPGHGRVAVGLGQPRQFLAHRHGVAQDHGVHFLELQRHAGVDHVLRRGAVVHPFPVVRAAARLQLLERRHQRMLDAADLRRHLADVDIGHLGLGADFLGRRRRDDAQLGLRVGQRRFEVQPFLDAVLFGKDGTQLFGAP
ncbi:hypothetical protein D3C72_1379690 [compost metagenome]